MEAQQEKDNFYNLRYSTASPDPDVVTQLEAVRDAAIRSANHNAATTISRSQEAGISVPKTQAASSDDAPGWILDDQSRKPDGTALTQADFDSVKASYQTEFFRIDHAGDVDWFKIRVRPRFKLQIRVTAGTLVTPVIEGVYRSDGRRVPYTESVPAIPMSTLILPTWKWQTMRVETTVSVT